MSREKSETDDRAETNAPRIDDVGSEEGAAEYLRWLKRQYEKRIGSLTGTEDEEN